MRFYINSRSRPTILLYSYHTHLPPLIILTGWGNSRFESNRPVSLQPDSISFTRVSAESSSESEAQSISSVSGVKGSKSKDERRSGMFRIFGRKGGDKEKEKEKDKRRSSQTPPQ